MLSRLRDALIAHAEHIEVDILGAGKLLPAHSELLRRTSSSMRDAPWTWGTDPNRFSLARPKKVLANLNCPWNTVINVVKSEDDIDRGHLSMPIIQNLQYIARHFQNPEESLEDQDLRKQYLQYGLRLFDALSSPVLNPSQAWMASRFRSAAVQALVTLPLGDVLADNDLLSFIMSLASTVAGLPSLERWYLITHPNVVPILVRAILSAVYIDSAIYRVLFVQDPPNIVAHTALQALAATAVDSDPGYFDPTSSPSADQEGAWPQMPPELCYAVVGTLSRSLGHGSIQVKDLFHDYLPLLRWMAESIVHDPATGLQAYAGGIGDLFVFTVKRYTPRATFKRLVDQTDEYGVWQDVLDFRAALLYLSLAYFGAQAATSTSMSDVVEFEAISRFSSTFILGLDRSEVAIDTVELVIHLLFAVIERGLGQNGRAALTARLDVASETVFNKMQEMGLGDSFSADVQRCRRAYSNVELLRYGAATWSRSVQLGPVCVVPLLE